MILNVRALGKSLPLSFSSAADAWYARRTLPDSFRYNGMGLVVLQRTGNGFESWQWRGWRCHLRIFVRRGNINFLGSVSRKATAHRKPILGHNNFVHRHHGLSTTAPDFGERVARSGMRRTIVSPYPDRAAADQRNRQITWYHDLIWPAVLPALHRPLSCRGRLLGCVAAVEGPLVGHLRGSSSCWGKRCADGVCPARRVRRASPQLGKECSRSAPTSQVFRHYILEPRGFYLDP